MTKEELSKALRQAFYLGQTFWQQADSDSYKQHKKADETRQKFEDLVEATVATAPTLTEAEVRRKVEQELRYSAFLHCDVNKEHVLLCIKHGCTLLEALEKEAAEGKAPAQPAPVFVVDHVGTSYGEGPQHTTVIVGHSAHMRALVRGAKLYEQPAPVPDGLRDAVNAMLHQIDIGDFVDSNGHNAKMLKPVHDLLRLMTAQPSPVPSDPILVPFPPTPEMALAYGLALRETGSSYEAMKAALVAGAKK